MQIRQILKVAIKELSNQRAPSLDARLLLCATMEYTHEELLLNYNQELTPAEEKEFMALVSRRKSSEPLAYILGQQEFYGLELRIDRNVLIPRPETELLIDLVLNDPLPHNKTIKILDLGTGSGAISIALAKHIQAASITATDISKQALEIAKINAEIHDVSGQINFRISDWYDQLGEAKYDYIISNPPYIAKSEQDQMAKETLLFEPELALYAPEEGLAAYKSIINAASQHLKPGGRLLLEIGYSQKNAIISILSANGFKNTRTHQDLAGLDRVIMAKMR
ncbi:MAG: protein-(glutamine-N5) methyltransferase, release factor-specific [Rickettsiales bacterium]|nr:MAG: protein-(glutamine-N5) methyltransferase, release factor-specific [Rickettsiales bacterium]